MKNHLKLSLLFTSLISFCIPSETCRKGMGERGQPYVRNICPWNRKECVPLIRRANEAEMM